MPDKRDDDDMDKRLEEELGEILDERAKNLPAPRTQSRGQKKPTRRLSLTRNAAIVFGITLLFFVMVRLGPVALRLVPLLILVAVGWYAYVSYRQYSRRR